MVLLYSDIKTHGSELYGQENAHAMTTESLFMHTKMYLKNGKQN